MLVTAGPTAEPIDPVRVITNRSSGKQGFAIAAALAALGARVTLVSGPVALATPPGVTRIDVETALQMLAACEAALPADAAVCVAAVADWRMDEAFAVKLKKSHEGPPTVRLVEIPDILARRSPAHGPRRPRLVVGFAAETNDLSAQARGQAAGARAATGSSPTTSAPTGSWGATRTRCCWSGPQASIPGRDDRRPRSRRRLAARIAEVSRERTAPQVA